MSRNVTITLNYEDRKVGSDVIASVSTVAVLNHPAFDESEIRRAFETALVKLKSARIGE